MCKHKTCKMIKEYRRNKNINTLGGVAAAILNRNENKWYILLGKQTRGSYKDKFSVCAGSLEKIDYGCYILGIKRELMEEFKIDVTSTDNFNYLFRKGGLLRYIMVNSSPVFIGISKDLNINDLNTVIINHNNSDLPEAYKEMSYLNYFPLSGVSSAEEEFIKISDFAKKIAKNIDVNKL